MKAPAPERFAGCLLGAMAGDCLGLPLEGLSPARARRLFPGPLRHRFLGGRGMVSDDTEHACLAAAAFAGCPTDAAAFRRRLAEGLRWWIAALPGGVGWATLRASARLWFGASPRSSGVWSAGNGPAMRSPILGLCLAGDAEALRRYVEASTKLTHSDPRAERGALAAALAARYGALATRSGFSAAECLEAVREAFPAHDTEGHGMLDTAARAARQRWDGVRLAAELRFERGVPGYIYSTLAAVLWAWLSEPFEVERTVERALGLGGDTDTVGSIAGALAGATAGSGAIPSAWLDGIRDYPRSTGWVRELALRTAEAAAWRKPQPVPGLGPAVLPRNVFFTGVVLAHGFRRLLPPY